MDLLFFITVLVFEATSGRRKPHTIPMCHDHKGSTGAQCRGREGPTNQYTLRPPISQLLMHTARNTVMTLTAHHEEVRVGVPPAAVSLSQVDLNIVPVRLVFVEMMGLSVEARPITHHHGVVHWGGVGVGAVIPGREVILFDFSDNVVVVVVVDGEEGCHCGVVAGRQSGCGRGQG